MTPKMGFDPHKAARANTAHCSTAVESDKSSVRRMRNGKSSEPDDKAGKIIGRSGNVSSMDKTNRRTNEACKAFEGDSFDQLSIRIVLYYLPSITLS